MNGEREGVPENVPYIVGESRDCAQVSVKGVPVGRWHCGANGAHVDEGVEDGAT